MPVWSTTNPLAKSCRCGRVTASLPTTVSHMSIGPHDRRTNPGSAEMRMHELSSGMRLPRAPQLTASILYMRRQRGKRRKGRRGVTDSTAAIAGRCEREQRPSITIGITTSARPLATVAGKRPICTGTPTRFQYRVYTLRCASPPGTRRQHTGTSTALFSAAVPDLRSQKAPPQRRWRRQPVQPSPNSPLVHANGDLRSTPPRTSGQSQSPGNTSPPPFSATSSVNNRHSRCRAAGSRDTAAPPRGDLPT